LGGRSGYGEGNLKSTAFPPEARQGNIFAPTKGAIQAWADRSITDGSFPKIHRRMVLVVVMTRAATEQVGALDPGTVRIMADHLLMNDVQVLP